jgi:hypothetical protein
MNERIQQKIEKYKKLAKGRQKSASVKAASETTDGLSKVIRSKRDADHFMAELNGITSRAK